MQIFYTGNVPYTRENAVAKIGETNTTMAQRASTLRQEEGGMFKIAEYLILKDNCDSVTKAVEGFVRWQLEKIGYENVGNDHFVWKSTASERQADYKEFTEFAIKFAVRFCEMNGIEYEICKPEKTARTRVKRRK